MSKHRLTAVEIAALDFSTLPQAQPYPAMQLFASDWLSGSAVQAMTPEQVGGFATLVAQAWIQKPPVSLPNDSAQLAQLARIGTARWVKVGALIHAQFVACADGRLRNPKQVNVWLDMLEVSDKRRGSRGSKAPSFVQTTLSSLSSPSLEGEDESEGEAPRPEGVPGKPTLTGSQQAVAEVEAALTESTDRFEMPTPKRIAKWLHDYGRDDVLAAIREHGPPGTLDGRKANYLHGILENRKRHGNRTTNRSAAGTNPRTDGRRTAGADGVHQKPSAADLGMRTLGAPTKR